MDDLKKWRNDGAEQLRYKYDLNNNSVVLDLGVYNGQWIDGINKYGCVIYGFEPVKRYFEIVKNKFNGYNNVHLFNYAVGGYTRDATISIMKDGSSIFVDSVLREKVKIKSIDKIWNELGINNVDLIKINVEGAEYEILEAALKFGLHEKMKNIQVQFHDFDGLNGIERRNKIREKLIHSHRLTYDYEFIWENWELNN